MNKYDYDEKQRRPFVHFPKKMPEGNQNAPFGLISVGETAAPACFFAGERGGGRNAPAAKSLK